MSIRYPRPGRGLQISTARIRVRNRYEQVRIGTNSVGKRAGRVVLRNSYSIVKERRPNGHDEGANRLYLYRRCCAAVSSEAKQRRKIRIISQIIRGDENFVWLAERESRSSRGGSRKDE